MQRKLRNIVSDILLIIFSSGLGTFFYTHLQNVLNAKNRVEAIKMEPGFWLSYRVGYADSFFHHFRDTAG